MRVVTQAKHNVGSRSVESAVFYSMTNARTYTRTHARSPKRDYQSTLGFVAFNYETTVSPIAGGEIAVGSEILY